MLASFALLVLAAGDTSAPVVQIAKPPPGAQVHDTLVAQANAIDNVGVAEVVFYLDDREIAQAQGAAPYTVSMDCSKWPGAHLLVAEARDAAGNVSRSSPVVVNIDGTPDTGCAAAPGALGLGLFGFLARLLRRK